MNSSVIERSPPGLSTRHSSARARFWSEISGSTVTTRARSTLSLSNGKSYAPATYLYLLSLVQKAKFRRAIGREHVQVETVKFRRVSQQWKHRAILRRSRLKQVLYLDQCISLGSGFFEQNLIERQTGWRVSRAASLLSYASIRSTSHNRFGSRYQAAAAASDCTRLLGSATMQGER